MTLYNLKTTGEGAWRITKFDPDLNVLSTYACTMAECECPQGHKPTCRHRKMLPLMKDRADTAWFWNYEQALWVDPTGQAEIELDTKVSQQLPPKPEPSTLATTTQTSPSEPAPVREAIRRRA